MLRENAAVPEMLRTYFKDHPRLALAFSGGVDSSYLLYAASACECSVRAYYVKTPFQPAFELRDAQQVAAFCKQSLQVIHADILNHPVVAGNPADRCYHCKKYILSLILERAAADGYKLLIDGTNASDDRTDRPGMKALDELSVRSPLQQCGLTKEAVRQLSKKAGLFTWDKPSYACLATRFPTGFPYDRDLLQKVEIAEEALSQLHFKNFRCRLMDANSLRLQFTEEEFTRAAAQRGQLRECLLRYFDTILIDTETRTCD